LTTGDKRHWAEAYFPGRRYGHFTSNIAESLNAWLLEAREMPIFRIMEYIRGHLMKWYQERSERGQKENALVVQSIAAQIQVSIKNHARRYRFRKSRDMSYHCNRCGAHGHSRKTCPI
jgi:hypothetical protein